eukprot:705883-Pyramimonas_sp.AAC.1
MIITAILISSRWALSSPHRLKSNRHHDRPANRDPLEKAPIDNAFIMPPPVHVGNGQWPPRKRLHDLA